PQEKKRISYYVKANVYPLGQHSYDNFIYELDKRETWEVNLKNGILVLKKK
ncbi:unnamed protein product, partial [marine sediment metagenome]